MKLTRKKLRKLVLQEMAREKFPRNYEMLNYIKEYLIREFGNHPGVAKIIIEYGNVYVLLSKRSERRRMQLIRIIYRRGTGVLDVLQLESVKDLFGRELHAVQLDIRDEAVFSKLRNYVHDILEGQT